MAKETGLGWTAFNVDNAAGSAQDLRTDVNTLEFATPRGVIEVTGIDKSAYERLLGLADFSVTPKGTFDDGANLAHAVLSTVTSTSGTRTVGITVSAQVLNVECIFTDYGLSRGEDGSLTWTAPAQLADGVVPTWTT